MDDRPAAALLATHRDVHLPVGAGAPGGRTEQLAALAQLAAGLEEPHGRGADVRGGRVLDELAGAQRAEAAPEHPRSRGERDGPVIGSLKSFMAQKPPSR